MKLLQDYYLRTSPRIHKIPLLESKRSPKICIAPQRDRYDTQHAARAKCWESCTHVKIRTAPQREWSDTHKATRGLREHMLDADEKWALKMTRAMFYQGLSHFFVEVYKVLRLPWKKTWGTRSVAPATRNHHVQNPKWRQLHKTRLLTLSKRRPSSCKDHLWFWPAPANVLATRRKSHACHTDENVSDVLHLSCKTAFQTSK